MTTFLLPLLAAFFLAVSTVRAGTSIQVHNEYKKELNIKIQGTGVGGCDIIMEPGSDNLSDCWCLWGTINYSFCAYSKMGAGEKVPEIANNSTVGSGKCPIVTGESLVCSDLGSLGNCYDGAYSCTIDEVGLCHCTTI